MRAFPIIALSSILLFGAPFPVSANSPTVSPDSASTAHDSDHDGLSDALEQSLLAQFVPAFMISPSDCSKVPASFTADQPNPLVQEEDGTIYGQVFPSKSDIPASPAIEIHYYHLWKTDCGRRGHPLDAEHVSVLLHRHDGESATPSWKAAYWYAAAHERTLCDASQISRASTLHAEDRGAIVWISAGKHASFLNDRLCSRGCGGDTCEYVIPLSVTSIVNLGEIGAPMNGASWTSSQQWPLTTKMAQSDFQLAAVARLERLPASDIGWVNPSKRPAQGTIAVSATTKDAVATGGRNADSAISLASDSAGNALDKSYQNVKHALGTSARSVGKFLTHDPAHEPKQKTADLPPINPK